RAEDTAAYVAAIEKERADQQTFMREDPSSPFVLEKKEFKGLSYFPVDAQYRVKAKLKPIENKEVMTLTTSDGLSQSYLPYAHAHFELAGTACRLLLLEVMQMGPQRGTLFLAFTDATSGRETYGAGRYVAVKKVRGATHLELDFNRAYNPYCAYVDAFSCPFPPKENLLLVAILAGEKAY
ncbi:MAG: DUF1684 domain-containing protein, partial [Cyclobacteriaceae bacterium]|nr:DUF1684 domain-containing protein [Cyclobacteriaceae bacterium]